MNTLLARRIQKDAIPASRLERLRRVEAIAWRRRAEVIRQQLVAQRQTVPA